MKRIISVALMLALALSLSGCCFQIGDSFTAHTASFSLYIGNNAANIESNITSSTSSDITASKELVYVYMDIMQSVTVLNKVIEETQLSMTAQQLKDMLRFEPIESASVLRVYVTARDPQTALDIAQALITVTPEQIKKVVEGSSVRIVDIPTVESHCSLKYMFR